MTIRNKCDSKSLIILENNLLQQREEFNEKDISAEQSQAEKDPWIYGKDEYPGGPKRLETKESEGKEKVNGLTPFLPEDREPFRGFKKSMQSANLAIQNAKHEMLIADFAVLTLQ